MSKAWSVLGVVALVAVKLFETFMVSLK